MTRVDEHGIPCIVQSIEFNGTMVTANLFDGVSITAPEIFSRLFVSCTAWDIEESWDIFYRNLEGWANMTHKQTVIAKRIRNG